MYSGYSFGTRRVWVGLNLVGNEVDLQAFEWVNPHPDKEVASIRLAADGDPEGILLLLAITAVK